MGMGILFWYFNSFHRYTNEIDLVVESTKKELPGNLTKLKALAIIAESEKGIINWSSRQAYYQLSYKHQNQSNTTWHLNWMLWAVAMPIYLDKDEVFLLWCHYALNYENRWGINNASKTIFNLPILEVSLENQAEIIAMVKSPSMYRVGSIKSKTRVKNILLQYENL